MNTSFSKKLAVLAGLELLLAASVLLGAFLVVVFAHEAALQGQPASALVAQLTFALSLLLPAQPFGDSPLRSRRSATARSFRSSSSASAWGFCCAMQSSRSFRRSPTIATPFRMLRHSARSGFSSSALSWSRACTLAPLQAARAHPGHGRRRGDGRPCTRADWPGAVCRSWASTRPIRPARSKCLGTGSCRGPSHWSSLVEALCIQVIVVAVREQRGGALPLSELLNCRLRGVEVTDVPGVLERVTGSVPVETLKSSWLIYGRGFPQGWARRVVKRAFDVVMATGLLVVATPVMLATAIAIFLESGRPIIFRQERVGLGGRTFSVLKFRSMRTDAEKDGVPRWASDCRPEDHPGRPVPTAHAHRRAAPDLQRVAG